MNGTAFAQGAGQILVQLQHVRNEAERQGRGIEAAGERASGFLRHMRNEFLALSAALLGARGVEDFVVSTVRMQSNLQLTSRLLGVSAKDMQEWGNAARVMGGSADDAVDAFRNIQKAQTDLLMHGQSLTARILNSSLFGGINVLNRGNNEPRSANDILTEITKVMQAQTDPRERQSRISALREAGFNETTILMITRTREEVEKFDEHIRKLGVSSDLENRNARELYANWVLLQIGGQRLGQMILSDLTPALNQLVEFGLKWLETPGNKEWLSGEVTKAFEDFKGAVISVIPDIKLFFGEVDKTVQSLGGWKEVTEALFILWAGNKGVNFITSVMAVVAALGPLGEVMLAIAAGVAILEKFNYKPDPTAKATDILRPGGGAPSDIVPYAMGGILGLLGIGPDGGMIGRGWHRMFGGGHNARGPGMTDVPDGSMSSDEKHSAQEIVAKLISRGETRDNAIAITANLMGENRNFDPRATNPSGHSGAAQWSRDRQALYEQTTGKKFADSTIDDQLDFLEWERHNSEKNAGDALDQAEGALAKTKAWGRAYERYQLPGHESEAAAEDARRGGYALNLMMSAPNTGEEFDKVMKRLRATTGTPTIPSRGSSTSVPGANFDDVMRGLRKDYGQPAQPSSDQISSSEMNIGDIHIHTAATDATGISKDIGARLKQYASVYRANTGLS